MGVQVFGKSRCVSIASERPFVSIVPGGKVSASLAYVRFPTVRSGYFVNIGACVFVATVRVMGKEVV